MMTHPKTLTYVTLSQLSIVHLSMLLFGSLIVTSATTRHPDIVNIFGTNHSIIVLSNYEPTEHETLECQVSGSKDQYSCSN